MTRGCYRKAGLDPRDTQYFKAHGTGIQAGDTVNTRAMTTVIAADRDPLLIGPVNTNLGHTGTASGLTGIIKTVLALERATIPSSINFEMSNSKLVLDEWSLKLVRRLETWPSSPVRRASINNFGYGGTNAHLIVEEATSWNRIKLRGKEPLATSRFTSLTPQASVLSGGDKQACQRIVSNLADFLDQHASSLELENKAILNSLAYTIGQRRSRFSWTAAHPVHTTDGNGTVVQTLRLPKFKPARSFRGSKGRIGIVFTDQGTQRYAMGRELGESYPAYRASIQLAKD